MPARKTRTRLLILAALVLAGVGLVRLWTREEPPAASPPKQAQAPARPAPAARAEPDSPDPVADAALAPSMEEQAMLAYLKSRYGGTIQNRNIQLHVLEKLIRYYRAKDAGHWRDAVLKALLAAFPDHYAELAANLQRWVDYEQWMKGNRGYLQSLDEQARRAAVWDERNQLFGKDAAQEIWASEARNQAFGDALKAIDATPNATLSERLSQYKESIEDVYQEKSDAFLQQHAQEAMNHFLDLDSVQKQLSAMTPEERAKGLREIRQGMGLDEEALKRWDALDQVRDARWETGLRYMKERAELAQKLSGPELEDQLRELRLRYFGAEAETIGQEEQGGFFRFDRPRKWGRN